MILADRGRRSWRKHLISVPIAEALRPLAARMPRVVREHEIMRVTATITGSDRAKMAEMARREILAWAQKHCGGLLPRDAWEGDSFEYFSGGRNAVGIRIVKAPYDFWAIRSDDPDKTVPGRVWTNEAVVAYIGGQSPRFSARQLVSTPEDDLSIEPHAPGFVQQIADKCGLADGPYDLLSKPQTIRTDDEADALLEMLVDPERTLPVFVLTVSEGSIDPYRPPLDAQLLARATLGIGHVIIVPAALTWRLTDRFGKLRSVFGGAARAYLPGFCADADPFAHRLFLPSQTSTPDGTVQCLRWMRSLAALESVRRRKLGEGVLPFATIRAASLKLRQERLADEGASDSKQLEAAQARIEALEKQLGFELEAQELYLAENEAAIARAEAAEEQLRRAGFRIQQLLAQIQNRGETVDREIRLPEVWREFVEWCDTSLAGRLVLTPRARSGVRTPQFSDVKQAARCLLWLANEGRNIRVAGGGSGFDAVVIEEGIRNSHCGSDQFDFDWQGKRLTADWHIKNGGNTREPSRCLRIYYAWDPETQQIIVADMPAHRRTGAS